MTVRWSPHPAAFRLLVQPLIISNDEPADSGLGEK